MKIQDKQKLYEEFAHRAHTIVFMGTDAHEEWDALAELFRQFEIGVMQPRSQQNGGYRVVKLRDGNLAVARYWIERKGIWPFKHDVEEQQVCDAHGRVCGRHTPFPPKLYKDVVDATIAIKRFVEGVAILKEVQL